MPRTPSLRSQSGLAILAAIFVIVVVSILALAGLYVASNNATANTGIRRSWKAFYAADAGAAALLANWDKRAYSILEPGDSIGTGWRTLSDGSLYRSWILRVDDGSDPARSLFRLRTIGRPGSGLTAQRVVVTLASSTRADEICCDAAVQAQGRIRLQGSGSRTKISGLDTQPSGWGGFCPAPGDDLPGIEIQDDDDLQINGRPTLEGDPPVLEDPSIDDTTFVQFGDVTYEDLTRYADIRFQGNQQFSTVEPVTSGGSCDTSVPTNWGDPDSPGSACFEYLPVVHVEGDLKLTGDAIGQGVLLIDGNLEVTGTVDYYGVIVVLGDADIKGTADVNGGMLVRNGLSATQESAVRGNTTIQYSSCAAARAIARAIAVSPLAGRHWFEVID